ncbi:MAG: Stp1/IreP family PP2C-type Ser/Thr phosphatase [Anaerolineales bacterium]|nr:Stp1/IreP family PP2C-type Ser/Thr phosphatase [Anaerolineales bacterium]
MNQIRTCPECGALNRHTAKMCKRCGAALSARVTLPLNLPESITLSAASPKGRTRCLPSSGFSELPRGAVVHKRFEVLQVLEASPHLNTYLAMDASTSRQCALLESDDPQHYQAEKLLAASNLRHPALIEIYDACQIKYGDHTRAYLAQEQPLSPIAPGNARAMTVLQWGAQLADALAHLHDKQIAHGDIQPAHLYLSNHQIKLGGFTQLAEFSAERGAQDVQQLAQTLQQLAIPPGQDAPAFASKVAQVIARALDQHYRDARAFQFDLQQVLDTLRHPSKITTLVGRLSDVGLRREVDEDALLTAEIVQFMQAGYQTIGLYAVADGMGGASAGEVASKIVTETIAREVTHKILAPHFAAPPAELDYANLLRAAIEQANADVLAERTRAHTDMGSTVVAALVAGTHAHIANVGDSRAYLITRDQITKLTKDHSLVQALADGGAISEEDARTHPQRNYILRNVGDKPQIAVDLYHVPIEPGQSLLLCCDGLWEMIRDEQIRQIVNRHANPQDACRELIQTANENGGDDNITCVLVRVESA